MRPHVFAQRLGDGCFLGNRARPQRRTGNGQPTLHHRRKVDLSTSAAQHGNLYKAAVGRKAVEIALEVVATHHVENHIDSPTTSEISHRGYEVGLVIVDGTLGTQTLARSALLRRAGR